MKKLLFLLIVSVMLIVGCTNDNSSFNGLSVSDNTSSFLTTEEVTTEENTNSEEITTEENYSTEEQNTTSEEQISENEESTSSKNNQTGGIIEFPPIP